MVRWKGKHLLDAIVECGQSTLTNNTIDFFLTFVQNIRLEVETLPQELKCQRHCIQRRDKQINAYWNQLIICNERIMKIDKWTCKLINWRSDLSRTYNKMYSALRFLPLPFLWNTCRENVVHDSDQTICIERRRIPNNNRFNCAQKELKLSVYLDVGIHVLGCISQ